MLYFTVERQYESVVLISSILGILLHIGLELFGSFFHDDTARVSQGKNRLGGLCLA